MEQDHDGEPEMEDFASPAIQWLDRLLHEAIHSQASHLHFHPGPAGMEVRVRADGVLTDSPPIPKALERPLAARMKVLAGMDLTERRRPQTGSFRLSDGGNSIFHVEVAPSLHGETITVAIEPSRDRFQTLDQLGLAPSGEEKLLRIAGQQSGLILVAGPSGSGKGTLLRALIRRLQTPERQFASIEQPVREELEGVCQLRALPSLGCDTARLLASARRLDVDVLMCSSLDTVEELRLAFALAAEGCAVWAGIATSDGPSTISRLVDMELEPGLIASHLKGVAGLRLARKLCRDCREPYEPLAEEWEALGAKPERLKEGKLHRARGCPVCRGTGYSGRTGLHEILEIDNSLRSAIWRKAGATELVRVARDSSFLSLREDGAQKVMEGITTVEEMIRALD